MGLVQNTLILSGLVIVLLLADKLFKRTKSREDKTSNVKERPVLDTNSSKLSSSSGGFKTCENRSEYSITSVESGRNSASLVVLKSLGLAHRLLALSLYGLDSLG